MSTAFAFETSGQSYKRSTIVIDVPRVVIVSNLPTCNYDSWIVIYARRNFIRFATAVHNSKLVILSWTDLLLTVEKTKRDKKGPVMANFYI